MHRLSTFLLAALMLVPACSAVRPVTATNKETTGQHSLLTTSTPANGTIVRGPVDKLQLHFSRPARVREVTVTGSDGSKMPTMVNAVGEVTDYSLPLDGVIVGRYIVDWKASSAGIDYGGSIHFDVK